jgi:membrane associated rhomboid family serine protease
VLLPISDENIPGRGLAWVTLTLIAITVIVFVFLQLPNDAFTYSWSVVPAEITSGQDVVGRVTLDGGSFTLGPSPSPVYLTLLSSMFMHGGWLHLGGNMLFLYIFGDNVEHTLGAIPFLLFYLFAGVVASFAQIFVDPESLIPSLGASGAIAGVLGAYIVLFPSNRVLVYFFYNAVWVPAVVVLGLWFVIQLISGVGQVAVSQQASGGVAYLAHVGGFVTGLVGGFLARPMLGSRLDARRAATRGYRGY